MKLPRLSPQTFRVLERFVEYPRLGLRIPVEPGYGTAVRDPLPHPHAPGQVLLARNDVGGNRRRGLAAPHLPSDGEGHGGGPGKVHTSMFRPKDYAGPCLDAEKFWFVVAGGSVVTLFLTLVLFLFLAQARDQATALQNAGTKVRRYKGSQFFAQGCTDFHRKREGDLLPRKWGRNILATD